MHIKISFFSKHNIPIVAICVGGGSRTIYTVLKLIEKETP